MKEATVRRHLLSLGIDLYCPEGVSKWATRPMSGGKPIHHFDTLDGLWHYWRARCVERLKDQHRVQHQCSVLDTAEPHGDGLIAPFKLPRRWLMETVRLSQKFGPISNEWLKEMYIEAAKDRHIKKCDTTLDLHDMDSSSARPNNLRLDHR